MIVLIDGVHIRAAPGYQTRHVDVTVGKSRFLVKRLDVLRRPPKVPFRR
jgi:hypothetical protein